MEVSEHQIGRRTPEALSRGANSGKASNDPLRDSGTLKFSEGGKNVQLQPTGSGRAVDTLSERHECDTDSLQVFQQRNEMLEIAPETVQPPNN
jgi:hypothetical protein